MIEVEAFQRLRGRLREAPRRALVDATGCGPNGGTWRALVERQRAEHEGGRGIVLRGPAPEPAGCPRVLLEIAG